MIKAQKGGRRATRIIGEYPQLRMVLRAMFVAASLVCISCGEPYKQCDETLNLGDEEVFMVTGSLQTAEETGDCAGAVPMSEGSILHLRVEDIIGGEECRSASGSVDPEGGPAMEWLGPGGRQKGAAKFRGTYGFDVNQCHFTCEFEFRSVSLLYDCGSPTQSTCRKTRCIGSFGGEWTEGE